MDVVVVLALVVLASVFFISLLILALMCYRRQKHRKEFEQISPFRLSKLAEKADNIENLGQLSPLIGELLEKNFWVYDVSGLLQHGVAVLRLCRVLTDKLATVPLAQAPPPINEAICMATRNIFPRFDDLLDVVAGNSVDIRVLEARAMSLGTVCWSLYLPFTLLNSKYKEMFNAPLAEMNQHLITIRAATELAAVVDKNGASEDVPLSEIKQQLKKLRSEVKHEVLIEEDEEEEDDGASTSEAVPNDSNCETTPLVKSGADEGEEEEEKEEEEKGDENEKDDKKSKPESTVKNGGSLIIGAPTIITEDTVKGSSSSSISSSGSSSTHPIDPAT